MSPHQATSSTTHPALKRAAEALERLGADPFELYFERRRATRIDSRDLKVDSVSVSEDVGLAIRLVKDRRMGFSFTTSLEPEAVDRAVRAAVDVATFMPEDEHAGLFSFSSAVYSDIDAYDSAGLSTEPRRKIELARELEAACRRADARITGVRSASLSELAAEVQLLDSGGETLHHRKTVYSASITAKAEQEGDSQIGGDFAFSNYLEQLDLGTVARQAATFATELLGAGSAPTLKCPAVLRNSVVAELIEFLSASFSAEECEKGRSLLNGKLGQRLFSEHVTLVDDGLLAGGYATSPFDGEGVPTARNTLVDAGTISRLLYDTYYARKLGAKPTGSASRGLKSPPSIGPTNLFLRPGRASADRLLEGISRGILITDLMGVHTANPVTGEFSLGASGILIENGKLGKACRGFAVAGNVLELFRRMTDIGSDLRFFGNVGAPSARISELSVGGA